MALQKQIIAVDIDDVLADNAEGFVAYSNKVWGTNLKVEEYDEHWEKIWAVDLEEVRQRSDLFHGDHVFRGYKHRAEAKPVLERLAQDYDLIIVTSRRQEAKQDTIDWIEQYYGGIFSNIHFAGIWDEYTDQSILGTKAALAQQLKVSYLIDDQLKHCLAAADADIQALLFGDYNWNQVETLPAKVSRCADWQAVAEHFYHES